MIEVHRLRTLLRPRYLSTGLLLLLGGGASVGTGQAQRPDALPPQIISRDEGTTSFRATSTVTGFMSGIHHQSNSFSVLEEKGGESWALFFLTKPKMKVKGSVKKALGKKKVGWTDLQDGFKVKVTFIEATREAKVIRVLESNKTG